MYFFLFIEFYFCMLFFVLYGFFRDKFYNILIDFDNFILIIVFVFIIFNLFKIIIIFIFIYGII